MQKKQPPRRTVKSHSRPPKKSNARLLARSETHRRKTSKPTNPPARRKQSAAKFRVFDQGVVQIQQDDKLKAEGKAWARKLYRAKTTVGRKPTLSREGSARLMKTLSKLRGRPKAGQQVFESLTVKVRYRGVNGKMKTRWENITTKHSQDVDAFIAALAQGITYETSTRETQTIAKNRGSIQEIKYEQISKVNKGAKARPIKTKFRTPPIQAGAIPKAFKKKGKR